MARLAGPTHSGLVMLCLSLGCAGPSFEGIHVVVRDSGPAQRNSRSEHLDAVVDENGTLYLATFKRPEVDDPPLVHVEAVSRMGGRRSLVEGAVPGRATGIARVGRETWVVGFTYVGLTSRTAFPERAARPFLVAFDGRGEIVREKYGPTGVVLTLLCAGPMHHFIAGRVTGRAVWDGIEFGEPGKARTFVAILDAAAQVVAVTELSERTFISDAAALLDGRFVFGGSVNGPSDVPGWPHGTDELLDFDAFHAVINTNGVIDAVVQFGEPGTSYLAERSRERVTAIEVRGTDVTTAGLEDQPGKSRDALVIRRGQPGTIGTVIHERAVRVTPPANLDLAVRENRELVVTYGTTSEMGDHELTLLELRPSGKLLDERSTPRSVNTAVRRVAVTPDAIWLVGHYQSSFGAFGQPLENDGAHELFVIRRPRPRSM